MFLLRGDGYVGELLELHQSVKDPFEAQREGGMSLEKPQCKSASSRVEGTISQFFSSCGTSPRTPSYNLRGIPIFPIFGIVARPLEFLSCFKLRAPPLER